jgi:hypothetical protein
MRWVAIIFAREMQESCIAAATSELVMPAQL